MSSPSIFRQLQLRFEYWLFDLPAELVGGRWLQLTLVPARYLYPILRDFVRGDVGLRAMSLVYTSLFALVPVVAVSFSVLKAFGYSREIEPVLFEFLRPLGPKGYELTATIMRFVENAQTTLLGTVGFVFLVYTVITLIQKLFFGIAVPGYASLLIIMLFFNSLLLISNGIQGEYIARIFEEVKGRPLYVVGQTIGFEQEAKVAAPPALVALPRK